LGFLSPFVIITIIIITALKGGRLDAPPVSSGFSSAPLASQPPAPPPAEGENSGGVWDQTTSWRSGEDQEVKSEPVPLGSSPSDFIGGPPPPPPPPPPPAGVLVTLQLVWVSGGLRGSPGVFSTAASQHFI